MARRTDFALLGLTLLLLTIGLAMLYSTSAVVAQLRHHDSLYFLKRQLLWAGFGLLGLWGMRLHSLQCPAAPGNPGAAADTHSPCPGAATLFGKRSEARIGG